ncbi:MAG: PD-(D/E)XK nuclease family protein [Coriobacteriales bacterium]|nr:PD-(D/E)XK nuclease family protein [Coriobacteriales bacterium]
MALQILHTVQLQPAGPTTQRALSKALASRGEAVLLVPSFQAQLDASRLLSAAPGLALGVKTTTPRAWLDELWEIWGDGSHPVDGDARTILMHRLLSRSDAAQAASSSEAVEEPYLVRSPGAVRVLEDLARRTLGHLHLDDSGRVAKDNHGLDQLTPAELQALNLVASYAASIHSKNLVEECEAAVRLPGLLQRQGVRLPAVVAAGFLQMERPVRDLLAGLSTLTDITLVLHRQNPDVGAMASEAVELVRREALSLGAEILPEADADDEACAGANAAGGGSSRGSGCVPELSQLAERVFRGADDQAIQPTGAFGVLLPGGPAAEAEALAQSIVRTVKDPSTRHVVVSAPDALRAWRELAPKLSARGLSVRAQLTEQATQTVPGRAFSEFVDSVAQLTDLASRWHDPFDDVRELVESRGGSMGGAQPNAADNSDANNHQMSDWSWWPPTTLVDFLMSDLSGMSIAAATRLDASWRKKNFLSPQDVLNDLANQKTTSTYVARATQELLRGRLGSAANRLLQQFQGQKDEDGQLSPGKVPSVDGVSDEGHADAFASHSGEMARAEARGVLGAVVRIAQTMRSLSDLKDSAAQEELSLVRLAQEFRQAFDRCSIVVRPYVPADAADAPLVEILPPHAVAARAPLSADVVVLCGQTSVESGIPTGDDVVSALVCALDVEPQDDPMARARATFGSQLEVARRRLVMERTIYDAQSKECFNSVVLTEALACYGVTEGLGADEIVDTLRARKVGQGADGQDAGRSLLEGTLSEENAFANLLPLGQVPAVQQSVPQRQVDVLDPSLLPLVVVPSNPKEAQLLQGKPLLSATQLETYLECPYKWFSLRRLNLGPIDAGFSATAMGTFVHSVMEITHRTMLENALTRMGDSAVERVQQDPGMHVAGCRASSNDPDSVRLQKEILDQTFWDNLRQQYETSRRKRPDTPLIPHTPEDVGSILQMHKDLMNVVDFESQLLWGYEPREFELSFGRPSAGLVEYAGAYIKGTIDRVDVDSHGHAIVIDYKHKRGNVSFSKEYNVFSRDGYDVTAGQDQGFKIPRHVQALMYGQVLRRSHPELTVVGSIYMATRTPQTIAGAVDANSLDNVWGDLTPNKGTVAAMGVPSGADFGQKDSKGLYALMDATEQAVAQKIQQMMAGQIAADPLDKQSCRYCPVMNCKLRIQE